MQTEYTYALNSSIQNNLIRIEASKKIIDFLPQLPHVEDVLRSRSLLKSSLFSAKIEGNMLEFNQVQRVNVNNTQNKEKKEVFNILAALKWIHANTSNNLTSPFLCKIHSIVMRGLSPDAGRFRSEPSAIFNQAGVAVYMPPPPSEINALIKRLIVLSRQKKEHVVVRAALVHFTFEKIHPYLDGNGRVGRLLSTFLLKKGGYDFRGLAVLEEYLNEHRDAYYDSLAIEKKDISEFVEFFTRAVAQEAEKVIKLLGEQEQEKPEDSLLPRRQEILAIIKEHKLVSFDFLKRRFLKVATSSLHYDLKMLLRSGFIKKLGSTRGVLYSAK